MSLAPLIERGGARVVEHAPVGPLTTYRVGGSVRVLVTLSSMNDVRDLGPLIEASGLPVQVIGNGSNLLVAEGEHEVVGLRLAGEFMDLEWHDHHQVVHVVAGAALHLPIAARRLAADGVSGFEWAVGVPGSFGGAVAMNAGGHGSDMAASLRTIDVWRNGNVVTVPAEDLQLAYRTSSVGPRDVVLRAALELRRGDQKVAQRAINDIVRWRREHQPGGANAGSVFRNPTGDSAGRLIDAAACKGLRVGSAVVSDKHANFIIVDVGGKADDVFELIGVIRSRVFDATGVMLESEHRFLGFEGRP